VLCCFLRPLPWSGIQAESKAERYQLVLEKKIAHQHNLCDGLPAEFAACFAYIRSLEFGQRPNYGIIRQLFRDVFERKGFKHDFVFDWTVEKYKFLAGQRGQNIPMTPPSADIIEQPEVKAINPERLAVEVSGIYASSTMVEAKCLEVDDAHIGLEGEDACLSHRQWQALTQLHYTALKESYDYFLASQHQASPAATRQHARENDMPARIWGVTSRYIALLQQRCPDANEHKLDFVNKAYAIFAALHETVPGFVEWREFLVRITANRYVFPPPGTLHLLCATLVPCN